MSHFLLPSWIFSLHYLRIAHCSCCTFSTSSFNSLILITVSFPVCHLDHFIPPLPLSTSFLITFKKLPSADHPPPLYIPRESGGENRSVWERGRGMDKWGGRKTPLVLWIHLQKTPCLSHLRSAHLYSESFLCSRSPSSRLDISSPPSSLASVPQYYFTCSIVQLWNISGSFQCSSVHRSSVLSIKNIKTIFGHGTKNEGSSFPSTVPWRTCNIHGTVPFHKRFFGCLKCSSH